MNEKLTTSGIPESPKNPSENSERNIEKLQKELLKYLGLDEYSLRKSPADLAKAKELIENGLEVFE